MSFSYIHCPYDIVLEIALACADNTEHTYAEHKTIVSSLRVDPSSCGRDFFCLTRFDALVLPTSSTFAARAPQEAVSTPKKTKTWNCRQHRVRVLREVVT